MGGIRVIILSGHDTPQPIPGVDLIVQSSGTQNSLMTASFICHNCTGRAGGVALDPNSDKQPWIWAVGPGAPVSSNSQAADIEQHSKYGASLAEFWQLLQLLIAPRRSILRGHDCD